MSDPSAGRPLLAAPVGGIEAWLIAQVLDAALPARLDQWERAGMSAVLLARVRRAYAAIGEAGRQAAVAEAERRALDTLAGADARTPVLATPVDSDSVAEIDTDAAASALGLSANRVRTLIREGRLRARKVGRQWLVPAGDVRVMVEVRDGV